MLIVKLRFLTAVLSNISIRGMVDFIYFIGRGPDKRWVPAKSLGMLQNLNKSVLSYGSYCLIVVLIYFMWGDPLINVNHLVVFPQKP